MAANKEPHYLCNDHLAARFTGPGDAGFEQNTVRSATRYGQLFHDAGAEKYVGEASVYYLNFLDTAEKIRALDGDSRVVMVLRNPVDRAYSAYMHLVRDGREDLSFKDALAAEDQRRAAGYAPLWWLRACGYYSSAVQHYIEVLGRDRVHVLLFEDVRSAKGVPSALWDFLDLAPAASTNAVHANPSGRPRSRVVYDLFAKPNLARSVARRFVPPAARRRLRQRAMRLQTELLSEEGRQELLKDYAAEIQALEGVISRSLTHWFQPHTHP